MLVPIYVFGSGSMQPSHIVLLLATIVFAAKREEISYEAVLNRSKALSLKIELAGRRVCAIFALFALYVCLVNAAWVPLLASYKPLLYASFQVYNLVLIYFIFSVASRDFYNFAIYTRLGFISANLIVMASIFVSGFNSASREEGLFNNPNQLAFFCLSSCLVFYVMEMLSIGASLWNRTMIGVACFICLLTLSRAGLVGCGLVFIASLFGGSKKMSKAFIIVMTGLLLVASASLIGLSDKIEARNNQTNRVFENQYEGRGYDRIAQNPEYILFGAGEGEYRRFGGLLASIGGEMHSSVGTLLFSYGIIGFGLYMSLWVIMFFSYPSLAYKICATAPVIYGLTHNGLRFSAAIIAIILMILGGLAARHQEENFSKI